MQGTCTLYGSTRDGASPVIRDSRHTRAARARAAAVGFCLALLLGSPSGEARASVDWLQYIASYVDLVRAFGPDPAAGEWHFQTYGRAEGRAADAFDEAQYLANYPDLQAAFGGDTQAATVHFIRYGAYEG